MAAYPLDRATEAGSLSPRHYDFIRANLPLWLLHASPAAMQRYFELAKRSARTARHAAEPLHELLSPQEFARPLLERSLKLKFRDALNVDQLQFLKFVREGSFLTARLRPVERSLLDAALENFEQDEDFGPGSALLPKGALQFDYDDDWKLTWHYPRGKVSPVTVSDFAAHCRTLDLGAKYQAYLASTLDNPKIQQRLEANFMDSLAVHAQVAWMRGHLQTAGLAFIEALSRVEAPLWDGHVTQARSLALLASQFRSGFELVGPLIFQQLDGEHACIVFLPNDPDFPLKEYPSLRAFSDELRERLREETYRAFFRRFVAQPEQWEFSDRLLKTLNPWPLENRRHEPLIPDPEAKIGLRAYLLNGGLAQGYRKRWHDRILSDAKALAVPTEEVDREARERRWMGYLQEGLTAAGIAGLFVPGLGELMLGVGAGQILADLAVGFDDWQHGQMGEAIDHLASVAENAATFFLFAAAGYGIQRSPFVESMELVEDAQGHPRLWHNDLVSYAVDAFEVEGLKADAAGVFVKGERSYLKVDRSFYAVERTADHRWRAIHPLDATGYRPRLLQTPEGGWRFQGERPLDWQGIELMRRWDPKIEGLTDEQLECLQHISGISSARLRRCHSLNEPMPAVLADTLQRFQLDQEISGIITRVLKGEPIDPAYSVVDGGLPWTAPRLRRLKRQLFEQAFEGRQQIERARGGALSRDFPGLPGAAVKEILAQASDTERGLLHRYSRVPLRMAEEAREYLNRLKLNRALLGFYCPDLAEQGTATLRKVFRSRLPADIANRAPGHAENEYLLNLALENRKEAEVALGVSPVQPWFRPPQRNSARHLGFALSGRGDAGFLPNARLQALYPALDDAQLAQLREELAQRGPLERVIGAREKHYQRLTEALEAWIEAPGSYLSATGETVRVSRESRQAAAEQITAAWRRETPTRHGQGGRAYGFKLNLAQLSLGSLPSLPIELDHIETLSLDDTQLTSDPRAFIRAFPKLRRLSLAGNRLTAVPNIGQPVIAQLKVLDLSHNRLVGSSEAFAPLMQASSMEDLLLEGNAIEGLPAQWPDGDEMPRLQRLDLSSNALSMSPAGWNRLTSLPTLRTLDLSNNAITLPMESRSILARMSQLRQLHMHGNPLGIAPDLSAMRELRVVSLGDTQISELPAGLLSLMGQADSGLLLVDLSSNQITDVPALPRLVRTPLSTAPHTPSSLFFSLHGNPLSEASLEHLRLADPGFEVTRHLPGIVFPQPPAPADEWFASASQELRAAILQARDTRQGETFFSVLDRCVATADYGVDPEGARARMRMIAEAAVLPIGGGEGQVDLRDQLYDAAEDVSRTCGDGVSLVLQRFEALVMAWRATSAALTGGAAMFRPLLEVSERLFRQSLLDESVTRLSRLRENRYRALRLGAEPLPRLSPLDDLPDADLTISAPDEAELRLKARRLLAARLHLPAQPVNQLYGAELSGNTLAQLAQEVSNQATQEGLLDWLPLQDYWKLYLRKIERHQFEAFEEHWGEVAEYYEDATRAGDGQPLKAKPAVILELETLLPDIRWRQEGIPAQVHLDELRYKEGYDHIARAQDRAYGDLIFQLSKALVHRHSELPSIH